MGLSTSKHTLSGRLHRHIGRYNPHPLALAHACELTCQYPHAAMIYGGLMRTTSGVAGGLAATDPKLVPHGAMTATFYTGVGCLSAPSVLFLIVRAAL